MNIRLVGAVAATVVALGVAGCGSSSSSNSASSSSTPATTSGSTSTPATSAGTTTAPATTGGSTSTIDAKALFVSGKSSSGAMACGGCHALKAAGTAGTVGPNLDQIAPDDKVPELTEMIADPNKEIVDGYQKGVMPADYTKSLTAAEIKALAVYINTNSAHSGD